MTGSMDQDDLELVDPGSKTQPAEGGRDEVEETTDEQAATEPATEERPDA